MILLGESCRCSFEQMATSATCANNDNGSGSRRAAWTECRIREEIVFALIDSDETAGTIGGTGVAEGGASKRGDQVIREGCGLLLNTRN